MQTSRECDVMWITNKIFSALWVWLKSSTIASFACRYFSRRAQSPLWWWRTSTQPLMVERLKTSAAIVEGWVIHRSDNTVKSNMSVDRHNFKTLVSYQSGLKVMYLALNAKAEVMQSTTLLLSYFWLKSCNDLARNTLKCMVSLTQILQIQID